MKSIISINLASNKSSYSCWPGLLRRVLSSFSARAMSSALSPGAGSGPPSLIAPSTQSVITKNHPRLRDGVWEYLDHERKDIAVISLFSPCVLSFWPLLTGDVSPGEDKISLDCDTGDITRRAWLLDCEPPEPRSAPSQPRDASGPGPGCESRASVCCYYCGHRETLDSAASQHPVSEIWKSRVTIVAWKQ